MMFNPPSEVHSAFYIIDGKGPPAPPEAALTPGGNALTPSRRQRLTRKAKATAAPTTDKHGRPTFLENNYYKTFVQGDFVKNSAGYSAVVVMVFVFKKSGQNRKGLVLYDDVLKEFFVSPPKGWAKL